MPDDCSRKSRFPLLEEASLDTEHAKGIDFEVIRGLLSQGHVEDALDNIPLDVHPELMGLGASTNLAHHGEVVHLPL